MAALDRFMDKVSPEALTGCWLWAGAVNNRGYGKIWDGEKLEMAHRMSWRLHRGPLGALKVLHHCDTPACVNPQHLFLGTLSDNTQDMLAKNRGNFVGGKAKSKLTPEQLASIKALRSVKLTGAQLAAKAAEFGMSKGGFYKIVAGYRWKDAS